ncbi:MAG: glycosyltransferase [Ignavibacteriaceae bacterium]|nr:glycosyltransferase [Ignavibacteriaceae bacterium]NUM71261.1 glycosyltransferase [Ignavibacteriaceae bacterium]
MAAEKICAVIVTYNRLSSLKACIEGLYHQTREPDLIIIVNNGSSDGTKEYLDKIQNNKIHVIHQGNSGGAGGFHTGLSYFLTLDFDWAWCMDDDGLPDDCALEALINTPDFGICVKNSLVLDSGNKTIPSFSIQPSEKRHLNNEFILNYASFFNGTLIHREILLEAGLPLKKLFIHGDEVEYFYRIKNRYKYPVITVTKSRFYHPSGETLYRSEWGEQQYFKLFYFIVNFPYSNYDREIPLSKSRFLFSIFLLREFFILAGVAWKQKKYKLRKILFVLITSFLSLFRIRLQPESVRKLTNRFIKSDS